MKERSQYVQGFRDGVFLLAERLRRHYPHSISILSCIDNEEAEVLKGGDLE